MCLCVGSPHAWTLPIFACRTPWPATTPLNTLRLLNGKLAEALKAEVLKTEDLNNRMLIQPWPDTIGALIITYTKLGVLLYV